ncbi:hypothetical protein ThvES_00011490 [Thiovulum sp. ES]|nr:hypothetical protein ThvES_00011490 [Thiovulum sp. ES]
MTKAFFETIELKDEHLKAFDSFSKKNKQKQKEKVEQRILNSKMNFIKMTERAKQFGY